MENLDLEAMRSKYSDLTVTAITKGAGHKEKSNLCRVEPRPHVQITRIAVDRSKENCAAAATASATAPASDVVDSKKKASSSYCTEYAAAFSRLEEVMFQQAQLASLTTALPFHVDDLNANMANANMDLWEGYPGVHNTAMHPAMPALDSNSNICEKYNELLDVVSGMRKTIPLCLQGLRIPKERLQVDLSNASSLIRECIAILERDM